MAAALPELTMWQYMMVYLAVILGRWLQLLKLCVLLCVRVRV